jgi:hypothetical protein
VEIGGNVLKTKVQGQAWRVFCARLGVGEIQTMQWVEIGGNVLKKVQGQAWRVFCARLGVGEIKNDEAMSSGQMAQLLLLRLHQRWH